MMMMMTLTLSRAVPERDLSVRSRESSAVGRRHQQQPQQRCTAPSTEAS